MQKCSRVLEFRARKSDMDRTCRSISRVNPDPSQTRGQSYCGGWLVLEQSNIFRSDGNSQNGPNPILMKGLGIELLMLVQTEDGHKIAGAAQRDRQRLWKKEIGDILVRDPSSDWHVSLANCQQNNNWDVFVSSNYRIGNTNTDETNGFVYHLVIVQCDSAEVTLACFVVYLMLYFNNNSNGKKRACDNVGLKDQPWLVLIALVLCLQCCLIYLQKTSINCDFQSCKSEKWN